MPIRASSPPRPARQWPGLGTCIAALVFAAGLVGGCEPADPLEEIRAQHAKGRFRPSVEKLRELVDNNPTDHQTNLLLGVSLLRTGESGSAIWPLRIAVTDPSLAVEAGLLLTEASLQSRFKNEAIEAADAVLALEPDNVAALEMRIEAYQAAGRNDEVLEQVARVLELDPENKKVLVPRIVAYLSRAEEEEAAEALLFAQQALEKDSDEQEPKPGVEAARARLCVVTAMFTYERGDRVAAEAQYTKCLQDHPTEPLVIQESVAFYDRTDRRDRATEILETALEQEPTGRFRVALARRMKNLGRLEESERLFREEAEENPSADAWFVLGDQYVRRDMLDEAVEAFRAAVDVAPNPPPMIVFAHADTLIQARRLDEAREAAKELEGTPLDDLIEGRVLAAEGKWEEALATFEKGIMLWPNNAGARFLAGETAEKLGRFDEAISHYRESIRADKHQNDSSLRLALLLEAQGLDVQALEKIGHYVRARADDPEGYAISIRLAQRVGQLEIVRRGLGRLAQLPGQQALALSISARFVGQQRGVRQSIKLIQGSPLELTDPQNADALEVLVGSLVRVGELEEAQKIVLEALEAHPDCADFHALLGDVLRGREAPPKEIAAHYRRATELDPDHAMALEALGALEAQSGRIDSALELYERASLADPQNPAAAIAALGLMEERASLKERGERAQEMLLRHPHSAAIASQLAQIEAERGEDPGRALELARRTARFDRRPRGATVAAFQAVANTGVEPEAGFAREALEALIPEPEKPRAAAPPPQEDPGAAEAPD
ncbi:MAG: tetratricopeptide repeat protein [Myxococcota bacterium]|nr:tetratricopeptide repeat protein [Myxococcota bacterium]